MTGKTQGVLSFGVIFLKLQDSSDNFSSFVLGRVPSILCDRLNAGGEDGSIAQNTQNRMKITAPRRSLRNGKVEGASPL